MLRSYDESIESIGSQFVEVRAEEDWPSAARLLRALRNALTRDITADLAETLCYIGALSDVPSLRRPGAAMLRQAASSISDQTSAARLLNQAALLAAMRGDQYNALNSFAEAARLAKWARHKRLSHAIAINRAAYACERGDLDECRRLLPRPSAIENELRPAALDIYTSLALQGADASNLSQAQQLQSDLSIQLSASKVSKVPAGPQVTFSRARAEFYSNMLSGNTRSAQLALGIAEKCVQIYASRRQFSDARVGSLVTAWLNMCTISAVAYQDAGLARSTLERINAMRPRVAASIGRASAAARGIDGCGRVLEHLIANADAVTTVRSITPLGPDGFKRVMDQIGPDALFGVVSKAPLESVGARRRQAERLNEVVSSQQAMEEFGKHSIDSGSAAVQIVLLSRRILALTRHLGSHPHDFASRRGLLQLVGRRRRMLRYLKESDYDEYRRLANHFGLTVEDRPKSR